MEVCTTLGMLSPEQAQQLRQAGLTAYNHNLDTSPGEPAAAVRTPPHPTPPGSHASHTAGCQLPCPALATWVESGEAAFAVGKPPCCRGAFPILPPTLCLQSTMRR